jgi:hypothetical protein
LKKEREEWEEGVGKREEGNVMLSAVEALAIW